MTRRMTMLYTNEAVVPAANYDALVKAAEDVLDAMDLTCMRWTEEIPEGEGCPCAICVLKKRVSEGKTGDNNG